MRTDSPLPQADTPAATLGANQVITVAARLSPVTPTPTPPAELLPGGPACGTSSVAYALDAVLDWAARTVRVMERVAFTNDTGQVLNSIVLAIPGVIEMGDFTLTRVAISDELPVRDYILRDSQIIIPLPIRWSQTP